MTTVLRVIYDSASQASLNMAVDEMLLDSNISEKSSPVLRFYSWEKPTLSIGCNQKTSDIKLDLLKEKDVALIRRPTGGRAVLHQNEITYSVVLPLSQMPDKTVYESCRLIHSSFYNALASMGINISQNLKKELTPSNPICFSHPSYSELTFDGKKIVGSAQMRRSGFIMQHGSIPFKDGRSSIFSFFNSVIRNEISQGIFLSNKEEEELLKENIKKEFCIIFDLNPQTDILTDSELKTATKLAKNKYESPEWTFKH